MKKSPLLILFLTVFLDLLGFGMILPLLPYYAVDYGANAFAVGALLAVYSLMQLIFSPVWGRLSDRIGRRPILLMSLLGSAIGLTIFGLANTLWLLFVSRLFSGVAAATISVAQAYITDSTTPENRAKGMGMIGAAFGLGFLFGPALGGVLAHFGHGLPAFVAAAIALANFAFAYFRLPESLPVENRNQFVPRGFSLKRLGRAATLPGMRPLMVIYFLTIFAFSTMEATFPLLTLKQFNFSEIQNGYTFAYIGVLIVILQGGLIGKLTKRYGERKLVLIGAACLGVSLAALPLGPLLAERLGLHSPVGPFSPGLFVMLVLLIPLAIGNGLCSPTLMSLISRNSESHARGEALGVSQSLASLGRILGPLWGGFAFAFWHPKPTYAIAGAIMIAMAFFALRIRPPADEAAPISPAAEPQVATPLS